MYPVAGRAIPPFMVSHYDMQECVLLCVEHDLLGHAYDGGEKGM